MKACLPKLALAGTIGKTTLMGKAIYKKLSDEEALKKYGKSSFVFVGGTGLVSDKPSGNTGESNQESVPENPETPVVEQ